MGPKAPDDGKIEVDGVRYHYILGRGGAETVVLLHGWGSTSYMWRQVIPELVAQGYTVLAPDLRGFGDTDKPATGYEKTRVADDIRGLVAALDLGPKVNLVGHDLGGMVAYAYAAQYPDEVRSLTIVDVPLPGIDPWDELTADPQRFWHFSFFGTRDVPELLISGRESEFLSWFHRTWAVNSSAFTNEVEETYAGIYARPGALRGGFEHYRAFARDAEDNREFAKHKLPTPVLGIGGAASFGPLLGAHLRNVADDVQAISVDGSGHWVPEERPEAVIDALLKFLPPPD